MDDKVEPVILPAVRTFQYLADHLKAYCSLQEEFLVRERSAMWDPYSSGVPRPDELDIDRYWGVEVLHPITLRESLFVTSFSHFEAVMNGLCAKIREARSCTVELSDLKGSGVNRARAFLIKVAGLAVPDPLWEPVTFLNRLRNLIVHNNSHVDSKIREHRVLQKTAKQWPTVEVPQDGRIKFHPGFNEKALDTFVEFFDQLLRNRTRYAV